MNIEYEDSIWSLDPHTAIADIEQLQENESVFYPESDYGHGFIEYKEGFYKCYEIPMYGGEPQFNFQYLEAEEAFNEVSSWT